MKQQKGENKKMKKMRKNNKFDFIFTSQGTLY